MMEDEGSGDGGGGVRPKPPGYSVFAKLNKAQSKDESAGTSRQQAKKIFIKNIEWSVHENLLARFVGKFGEVKRCSIIRDEVTAQSTGKGYAEFVDEESGKKMLEASEDELLLNGRCLQVSVYVDKKPVNKMSKRKCRQERIRRDTENSNRLSMSEDQGSDEQQETVSTSPGSRSPGDLPYNVLSSIFSMLTVRDLCIVEQVCKNWYLAARLVWRTKRQLVLNDETLFGEYYAKSSFGFSFRPDFTVKALRQLMYKSLGANLTHLDLSQCIQKFDKVAEARDCVDLIRDHCVKLTYLNISGINAANSNMAKMFKNLRKLTSLNISFCYRLTDTTVARAFQYCKDLQSIDLTNCFQITGACFELAGPSLTKVILDSCENIQDEYLRCLFTKSSLLKHLSLKRRTRCSPQLLTSLIQDLNQLEVLNLTDSGFDSLSSYSLDDVKFDKLAHLTSLDISASNGDNKIVAMVLRHCSMLKYLDVSNCLKLTDEMFTSTPVIHAPLEQINLSMLRHITDVSLDTLSQAVCRSLRVLKIKGCSGLTNQGIANSLAKLTGLTHLDIRLNSQVNNNLVLETALSLDYRHINMLCYDTNIDTRKFAYDHASDVKRVQLGRGCVLFKCKNLEFEALESPMSGNKTYECIDGEHVWTDPDGGIYFMGSDNEDDYDDMYDFEAPRASGLDHRHDYQEDYDEDDDLEDFLNNDETEMLQELDYSDRYPSLE